ncbi:MAG: urocanate hydratase [Candidatus Wallbacteria bacterium HGW-Wallbacteria-1]|jgi:urocanate hydratase|uniref:Urocanate hydratase n=1 Tax=Candidatus Wallbacteria bacterium HGW-Wallbacteria-1 TaxID=2013854 RepID=A0A2N1PQV7_9BACT|nr:MAG: urocanate hydratase [Candidatus Wallbacteria bacterium HGW-Wallbacteria-1]
MAQYVKRIEDATVISLPAELPEAKPFREGIRRAPDRGLTLSPGETALALSNALRYIHPSLHREIAPEFLNELRTMGRIYGYRFRPDHDIKARPVGEYTGKTLEGKAMQLMIDNNLDFDVALYPYELVTYGESGQVCQNWMQYQLIMKYLQVMDSNQTLVVASGHPLGLFPSTPEAPRVISTNGLMIGMHDNPVDFHRAAALGVANYGQMTAGGWMYIGPQGIVHGTYITLLNAGRLYLGVADDGDLKGKLFISSGLGGMSGAQPKAMEIAGGVSIIAEVDKSRIETRHSQGWVSRYTDDMEEAWNWAHEAMEMKTPLSIAFHGNIVDLLEYLAKTERPVQLLSDQTSCHAVYEGGYTPQGLTFEQGRELMARDSSAFRKQVDASLRRHFELIQILARKGATFWDYGNSFMKSVLDAGSSAIAKNGVDSRDGFIFPSYVENIMGPICFDRGFGPFRWVCLSGRDEDLQATDQAAMACIDPERSGVDRDNFNWIKDARQNNLVVGSQARILYSDARGRVRIALKFNSMVRDGIIGPVMLGRDHHDVSGTDSPLRETANIRDGSNVMAEMAVHCFAGNASRGMSLCVLSNGGGVGIGRSFNGGFGLVLDGSQRVDDIIRRAIDWDVTGGVTRRAWARNENAIETMEEWNRDMTEGDVIRGHATLPWPVDEKYLADLVAR